MTRLETEFTWDTPDEEGLYWVQQDPGEKWGTLDLEWEPALLKIYDGTPQIELLGSEIGPQCKLKWGPKLEPHNG